VRASASAVRVFLCRHLDKSESLGPTGDLVTDNVGGCDLPEGFDGLPQILFRGVKRQISYIDRQFLAPF